jgi:peroxiredoxin family protein
MTTETAPMIVPRFDEDDTDRKLAIICSKGTLDMAYPGLILGNAALGEGVETHLFFTFWGFDMIMRSRARGLAFSPVANTAMHLPLKEVPRPGPLSRVKLPDEVRMPQALAPAPGVSAMATRMMKKQLAALDVPEVPEFLDQIVAAGGHLWACRLSADMYDLDESDFRDDIEGIISAADFIEMTAGAQLLFI